MARQYLPVAPSADPDDVLGLESKCADLARRCSTIRDEIKLLGAHDAIGSASERKVKGDSLAAAQGALLEVSVALSMNRIAAGFYREAIESSQDALASSQSIFGEGSIDTLIPSLLLAESSLGVGKISEVEELLSAASWVLVQRGGPEDHALRARLLCVRGRLQAEQHRSRFESTAVVEGKEDAGAASSHSAAGGRLEQAQASFAEEAFEASMAAGPGSLEAAAAFFRLGMIALALADGTATDAGTAAEGVAEGGGKASTSAAATAFFDKVVEIWYQQVAPLAGEGEAPGGLERGAEALLPQSLDSVTLASVAEAVGMLREVRDYRLRVLGGEHVAYQEARLALGMVLWAAGAARAGLAECRTVPAAMERAMEEGHPAVETARRVVGAMEFELEAAEDANAGLAVEDAATASGGGAGGT